MIRKARPGRAALIRPVIAILALAICFAPALSFSGGQTAPDFSSARDEVVQILSGFVQVDTSNPPGNETKGTQYLKSILDREGIPSETFEMVPGRGNIVARLKGNGKKRPILLMGHIDVVGVERDKWTIDPFGGIIKDGFLYGRGSSDDKGMTSACLEVFLLLHRLKVPLDRDVIFLAEAGEEGTPEVGIEYMIKNHWDKIECEYALNEGGWIQETGDHVQYVGISTTEKVPRGIRLVATGTSGHGSVPRPDNPITHLSAAVARVGTWQSPMRLNETTRAFFERLAKISAADDASIYRNLDVPEKSLEAQERLRARNLTYDSMLRTSIVPTIIKGGFRSNVIPAEAEVTLDVRALPDEDMPRLIAALSRLIDDPAVKLIPPPPGGRPSTPPSSLGTDLFHAFERTQKKMFPDSVTLPVMLTGATDSAQLREKGVQAYGLGSLVSNRERSGVHGNDERLSIEGLGKFVEFIYRSVTDVAGSH